MEKDPKNPTDRTDLIAAGRKMLHRFQKKKESSSNRRHVKKSHKNEESEEADSVIGSSATDESIQQPNIEAEVSSFQFLIPNLFDDSGHPGIDITNDCSSSLSESIKESSLFESHCNIDLCSDMSSHSSAAVDDSLPTTSEHVVFTERVSQPEPVNAHAYTDSNALPVAALESGENGEAQVTEVGTMQESEYSCSTQLFKDDGREDKHSGALDIINVVDTSGADLTRTPSLGRSDPDYSCSPLVGLVEDSRFSEKNIVHLGCEDHGACHQEEMRDKVEDIYRKCSASQHSLCEAVFAEAGVSENCRSNIKKLLIRCSDYSSEEIPVEIESDELQYLIKLTELSSSSNLSDILDDLELLREQCFLSNTSRDFLLLLLSDQSTKMTMIQKELTDVQEKNESLSQDIIRQSDEICASSDHVREQMQMKLDSAASVIEAFSSRVESLETDLGKNKGDMALLSSNFSHCGVVVKELESEKENLKKNLYLLASEKNQLEIEKDYLIAENSSFLLEVTDLKTFVTSLQMKNDHSSDTMGVMDGERVVFENEKLFMELPNENNSAESLEVEICELRERLLVITGERDELEEGKHMISIELCFLFEVMAAKLGEFKLPDPISCEDDLYGKDMKKGQEGHISREGHFSPKINILDRESDSCYASDARSEETTCNRCCLQLCEEYDGEAVSSSVEKTFHGCVGMGILFAGSVGLQIQGNTFGLIQRRLKDAENIINQLDIAIECIICHSNFVGRSDGEVLSIKDSESEAPFDEQKLQMKSAGYMSLKDTFLSAKQQIGKLKAMLVELGLHTINENEMFKLGSEDADIADVSLGLNHQSDCTLGADGNMESEAFSHALNQFFYDIQAMNSEITDLCGTSRDQCISLKGENAQLTKKFNNLQSRISRFQDQLHMIRLNFDEVSSTVCYQLENFQKELDGSVSLAEKEWMRTVSQISMALHRLDASVCESYAMNAFPDSQYGLKISSLDNSVDNATMIIEKLQEKLEAAHTEIYLMRCSYADVNKKYLELYLKSDSAIGLVHKVHSDIQELVVGSSENKTDGGLFMEREQPHVLSYYQSFEIIFEKLRNFLQESLQLKFLNETLEVEIINQRKEADELRQKLLNFEAISKMIKNKDLIKGESEHEGETDASATPISSLQIFVSSMMQKYKEATEAKTVCEDELGFCVAKVNELNAELSEIFSSNMISENENCVLKECLNDAKTFLNHVSSELHKKITELEQSELRLTSVREKLGIAVSKGKGLIGQRDHLKKSLAEASDYIKRLSEDVKKKDEHVLLIETKLGSYSEENERVEALESELSCMRKSTSVLRESFLLNDSRLRRMEEILQEIDVPDNIHSLDLVEKVECLARLASLSNSEPHKDSFDGVPHSDPTLVVIDSQKQDVNANINNNDLERYEELQNKFHELTEQNEMLEQSLVERNNLIQMWENLLNRINAPPQLETMEVEDRIEWFGCAFLEADHIAAMLQLKIENLESYCKSLTADLDESRRKTSDLETALHEECLEKDHIEEKLELYMDDYEAVTEREMMFEIMAEVMEQGVRSLRELLFEKIENESQIHKIHCGMSRVYSMIGNVWPDLFNDTVFFSDVYVPDHLEVVVGKLIEKCRTLVSVKASILDIVTEGTDDKIDASKVKGEEQEIVLLKKYMQDASRSLSKAVADRDVYMVKNSALEVEIKDLCKRCEELQGLHTLEEQKTASAREKLNVAVRKGKALVQQRDNLKHTVEELNVEATRHQTEITNIQNSVVGYEEKMVEFSTCQGRVHTLEVENLSLRKCLEDTEHCFREKQHALDIMTNFLDNLDDVNMVKSNSSLDKLEQLHKLCLDLQVALDLSQDESGKTREEAEFLTVELHACRERNSRLVEELGRISSEFFELTRERDEEEASKHEALSLVEQLSTVQSDAKNKQLFQFSKVKSSLNLLIGCISDLKCAVDDVSSKDLEFLHELEIGFGPCLKSSGNIFSDFIPVKYENKAKHGNDCDTLIPDDGVDICDFVSHHLDGITAQVCNHKEILTGSKKSFTAAGKKLCGIFEVIQREMTCNRELVDCMKNERIHMEHVSKQKDLQVANSHTCISLLHEACVTSIQTIYNKRSQLYKSNSSFQNTEMGSKYTAEFMDIGTFANAVPDSHSAEHIRNTADKMLESMNDFFHSQEEAIEEARKEMRCTISNLQEVIKDKEIEIGKIHRDLTATINEADSLTTTYKTQVHYLKCELSKFEEQRKFLEEKVEDSRELKATVNGLQEKVSSLTEVLVKKEQEIDALAQALDVEEAEMEELNVAMGEMEKKSQQKAVDLKKLETLHAKGVKKLSITVSKFDELHLFSKHLLTEVEELQSKLHERDAEVSILRQEVTRCAKEALTSPRINVENSGEIQELFWCVYSMLVGISSADVNIYSHETDIPTHDCKQILENQIANVVSELESLRIGVKILEMLLGDEKLKVNELLNRGDVPERSLNEKESKLRFLEGVTNFGQETTTATKVMEIESVRHKRPDHRGPSATPQICTSRKPGNHQVTISLDVNPGGYGVEEEDDDKSN